LACAAARTVLAVIEEDKLLARVEENGAYLGRRLLELAAAHPKGCVGERGRGLLRALVLAPGVDARLALNACRERGVLLTVAGSDGLRFTPPLVISKAELDESLALVDQALTDLGW
ncbi:MAG: aminotransferase class III-fold pyridoxal phosphate-dependent enzyme, partial [Minicystis sp.]